MKYLYDYTQNPSIPLKESRGFSILPQILQFLFGLETLLTPAACLFKLSDNSLTVV